MHPNQPSSTITSYSSEGEGCEFRRTWLILPVVICLFQGLSHANVRVPVFRHRGVCVRLIIRLIVYPTKDVFLTFLRDNCANRTANTTGEDSATIKPVEGETYSAGVSEAVGRDKDQRRSNGRCNC